MAASTSSHGKNRPNFTAIQPSIRRSCGAYRQAQAWTSSRTAATGCAFERSLAQKAGSNPTLWESYERTMSKQFSNLTVITHPLVQHKLSILRDKSTSKKTFRALVD